MAARPGGTPRWDRYAHRFAVYRPAPIGHTLTMTSSAHTAMTRGSGLPAFRAAAALGLPARYQPPLLRQRQLSTLTGSLPTFGRLAVCLARGITGGRVPRRVQLVDEKWFSAPSPYTVTSWAPDVVGTYGTTSNASDTLNTIAFVGGNCADAYIGGHFSSVNGTAVQNIAPRSAPPPATRSPPSRPSPRARRRPWSARAVICWSAAASPASTATALTRTWSA